MLGGEWLVPVQVVANNLHTKGSGSDRHLPTDAAHADDAESLAGQFAASLTIPSTGPRRIGVKKKVFFER